ncbi:MAG: hypothetical protein JWL84_5458 [Rhodospirillales bacterium]|jgi:hypothetical protein|nr:hypothetical protein [Rhodospirillales bacterium]
MMSPMREAEEFLERAVECEELAAEVVREHDRNVLLRLAKRWREIAAEEMAMEPMVN